MTFNRKSYRFEPPPIEPARNVAEIWASWCGTDNAWHRTMMEFDAFGGLAQYWCGMPRSASAIPLTFALYGPDGAKLPCNYRLRDIRDAVQTLRQGAAA